MFTDIRVRKIIHHYFYEFGGLVKARSVIKRSKTPDHPDKTEIQDLKDKIRMEEYFIDMHQKIREESLQKIAKFNLKAISLLSSSTLVLVQRKSLSLVRYLISLARFCSRIS